MCSLLKLETLDTNPNSSPRNGLGEYWAQSMRLGKN